MFIEFRHFVVYGWYCEENSFKTVKIFLKHLKAWHKTENMSLESDIPACNDDKIYKTRDIL
jgi:hypothetical protein